MQPYLLVCKYGQPTTLHELHMWTRYAAKPDIRLCGLLQKIQTCFRSLWASIKSESSKCPWTVRLALCASNIFQFCLYMLMTPSFQKSKQEFFEVINGHC